MNLDERIWFLLLGCLIGFVLGYIVRSLQLLRKTVDEIDEMTKDTKKRNESGYTRHQTISNSILFVVVILTVWASFTTQHVSNHLSRVADCNQTYLSQTIGALNERTDSNRRQLQSNFELQKASRVFLEKLIKSNVNETVLARALSVYLDQLSAFVDVSDKSKTNVIHNPYPTKQELHDCFS